MGSSIFDEMLCSLMTDHVCVV